MARYAAGFSGLESFSPSHLSPLSTSLSLSLSLALSLPLPFSVSVVLCLWRRFSRASPSRCIVQCRMGKQDEARAAEDREGKTSRSRLFLGAGNAQPRRDPSPRSRSPVHLSSRAAAE